MGYIYKRTTTKTTSTKHNDNQLVDNGMEAAACDPRFANAFQLLGEGLTNLKAKVDAELELLTGNGTSTRASRRRT